MPLPAPFDRLRLPVIGSPLFIVSGPELVIAPDGWTVSTIDGTPSAQFEHTILVTKTGAEILTLDD